MNTFGSRGEKRSVVQDPTGLWEKLQMYTKFKTLHGYLAMWKISKMFDSLYENLKGQLKSTRENWFLENKEVWLRRQIIQKLTR